MSNLANISPTDAAKILGRLGGLRGGKSKSHKKKLAARKNGSKGGRPQKKPSQV